MLKLKLQYFGHLMQTANSLEKKDPNAGKDWGQEEKGTTEKDMVYSITDLLDMSLSKLQGLVMEGKPGVLQSIGSQRVGHKWATECIEKEMKENAFVQSIYWFETT